MASLMMLVLRKGLRIGLGRTGFMLLGLVRCHILSNKGTFPLILVTAFDGKWLETTKSMSFMISSGAICLGLDTGDSCYLLSLIAFFLFCTGLSSTSFIS